MIKKMIVGIAGIGFCSSLLLLGLFCSVSSSAVFANAFPQQQTAASSMASMQTTGSIAGTVTNSENRPLANIRVEADQINTPFYVYTYTNSLGYYQLDDLASGVYEMWIDDENGDYLFQTITNVVVEAGSVTNLDVKLSRSNRITGTVTDDQGDPLAGVSVSSYRFEQDEGRWSEWRSVVTNSEGQYDLDKLYPFPYRIEFSKAGYLTEYYNDVYNLTEAATIVITGSAKLITDINAQLAKASRMTGVVADTYGNPLRDIAVDLYVQQAGGFKRLNQYSNTDPTGHYSIDNLQAGVYRALFKDGQSRGYITTFYPNAHTLETATDILVGVGETISDVNIQLAMANSNTFTDCQGISGIAVTECQALVALYTNTQGPTWTHHDGWLSTNTPCYWYGVECNYGYVEELNLRFNGLRGELPSALESLVDVEELWLDGNSLTGAIPRELGNLAQLNGLYLTRNQLTGAVPAALSKLPYLIDLYLGENRLTGSIPAELGNLPNLNTLYLYNNQLTGTLPVSLSKLRELEYLSLSSNQLSGVIPSEYGALKNLLFLQLSNNALTGEIPSTLGQLKKLYLFSVSNNQLSGSIPPALGNLTNLQELWLTNNALRGAIPAELGNLQNLKVLYLSANQLRGAIPSTFGNLHNLTRLSLYANQLSGEIPAALGNLTRLTELTLYDNRLTGNIPPELGALANLNWLTLADNQLTGELPSHLANLVNLTGISVSGNAFQGPLPSALTQLTKLSYLLFYNTNLCEPTDADVQSWLGKLQWFKGTGLPCGATPGGLTGTVTNPSGQPLANIQVSFYRNLSNNLWQRMAGTTTDAQGRYTMGGLGQVGYQLFFADPTGQYGDEYYNDAGTLATATTITPTLGTTLTANAQLDAPVLPVATVESTTAGVTTDTRTGEVNITMARPHKSDITISRTATCDGGALPTTVELLMVQAGVTLTYTMQATATPDAYQATIPQADMTANANLRVHVTCSNASSNITIGTLQLYDPSGLVTDSASGLPIVDAVVTLYHVPGWHARLDANDTAANTCESNLSKAAGAPWSQQAPINAGVLFNPDTDTANPDVSTMRTNHLGQYGWDVPAGCWYVVVTAAGYETKVSPVVGVPPAVTDLHVALTKNSTATPTSTSTVTPTPVPTVTPTPPTQTPVPTPTPGDLNNEPPRVYLPLVVR